MSKIIYECKWMYRKLLILCNSFLVRFIDIRKLKMLNAKWLKHRDIDIYHPEKLNEKILWLEYNTDSKQRSRLTDKYEVREYINAKGYEEALIPLYGVYNHPSEINFDELPSQFVLKGTHGCDMNYICQNKENINKKELNKKLKLWMNTNLAYMSLETHYLSIKPRILCEQFLASETGDLADYKFHCCDGKARFVLVCTDRKKNQYRDVFDMEWNARDVVVGAKNNPTKPEKPKAFDKMVEMANCLAEGIPFVRIDLYELNGKIYFGEMTFTPAAGLLFHFNDEFLLEQGKYCTITKEGKE